MVGHAATGTRWAESTTPARERAKPIVSTVVAVNTCDTVTEDPAGRKRSELILDEPRELPITGFGPFEEGLEVALKHPIEHRGLGVTGTVERSA